MSSSSKKNSTTLLAANDKSTLHQNLEFTAIEQYKLLRTNLNFTLPQGEKCPVIGITSAMRGEGKSTTAINLSYVLAEKGSNVLLIDGDLRMPSVAKKMKINNDRGLTDLLMGSDARMSDFRSELLSNWYVVPSGDIPPNPSELLGSKRMQLILNELKQSFDYIIIDLPPVNLVSDALSISEMLSGMVVVIREDYSEKKDIADCFRQLSFSDVNVLGCVINSSKSGSGTYNKYKKSRSYKKYVYYRTSSKDDTE
ncbi:MAG: CpsD/CapB family tyrosine-protein kinase [Oscillospiraceae bacterium]|jgi:capsular exopolysaccharide synthesis family protein|nr:CpsD/CapB family tyrosine-protein kinase [Oscillospiraceae bacterium]